MTNDERRAPGGPGEQFRDRLLGGVADRTDDQQHIVGAVVPFLSWLDGLWQLWDKPYQQCLHDKVAQTVVVKVNR